MPDTASLSKTVAVLASPSRIDDMVTWVTSSVASLGGSSLLAAPKELADRLLQAQQLALDSRILSLRIVALDLPDPDVVIAGKVLAGEVQGVILFKDFQTSTQATPDLNLLTRVCDTSQTPMALNKATADLALRGVSNTRVAYLIYNPVAGQGDSVADLSLIRSILEPSIILHVVMTEKDRDVTDQAREIVTLIQAEDDNTSSSMQSMIVASGGDGTVAAIAGATMSTGIPFAAIPRGTANAFSVALGIPTDVGAAAHTILNGHVRVIDGAMCNDTPFINLAGVGFEAGLVKNATRELKNVFGNIAYMIGGAQQSMQQKPFKCQVQIDDGDKEEIETKIITVANVAPPSSVFAQGFGKIIPDDGLLEVTISTSTDTMGEVDALASLWASSVVQAEVPSKNLIRIRAKTVTVDADPPQRLLLDGEVLEMNPVTFQVIPNGLSVVTPSPDVEK